MKKSTIFWGVFLIIFGSLLLLAQLDIFDIRLSSVWRFWPVLLILWGISLFKIPEIAKYTLVGLSAVLLAIFLAGALNVDSYKGKKIDFRFEKGDFEIFEN